MASKRPWKVGPSMAGRQAYVHVDENGTAWVRQVLRTEDGRVLHFDMTPEESTSLQVDLESARMVIISGLRSRGERGTDYPDARF